MSADLAFVFENAFSGLFNYDAKYDELTFTNNDKITITDYPINLRKIWYKFYPQLLKKYKKLGKVYNEQELMNDIEKDELLPFIPTNIVDEEILDKREFHKLLEDDYKFQQLSTRSDRKHFEFSIKECVKYDLPDFKGWNINLYLQRGLLKIKDIKGWSTYHIDIPFVVQWLHKFTYGHESPYFRFTDEKCSTLQHLEELKQAPIDDIFEVVDDIIRHHVDDKHYDPKVGLVDTNLLNYASIYDFKYFNLDDYVISKFIINKIVSEIDGTPTEKFYDPGLSIREKNNKAQNIANELCPRLMKCKYSDAVKEFSSHVWVKAIKSNEISNVLTLIDNNEEQTDSILNAFPECYIEFFDHEIEEKKINSDNWSQMWNKYCDNVKNGIPTFCGTWIKTFHAEPPLELYISPNEPCGKYHCSTSSVWSQHVNRLTIPNEMKSLAYWQYMKSSNGKKRNPNDTIMYSFFSNSDENKIIFCRSDVELQEPARVRYNIPVQFSLLKPFLHEEIDTNNICLFTHLTKDDWNKVAGGNDKIDVVVFSEMKNIYRERTPLKLVLEHFTEAIALKFGVECERIE